MEKQTVKREANKVNRLIRRLIKTLAILLFVLIIIPFIFHIGFVQNWLANKICKSVADQTHSTITIGKIDFSIFKGLILKDFYISTPHSPEDTLAFIGEASTTLKENVLSLVNNRISIQAINLYDADIHVKTKKDSLQNNLETFLASFSTEKKHKSKSSSATRIDLKNINLRNIGVHISDERNNSKWEIGLDDGHIGVKSLDILNDSIVLESVSLLRPVVSIVAGERISTQSTAEKNDTLSAISTARHSYLAINNIEIQDGNFKTLNPRLIKNIAGSLDINNLDVMDVNLTASDFSIKNSNDVKAHIENINLKEHNGFILEALSVDSLKFNPNQMLLKGFSLKTEESIIRDYLEFKYDDLGDFGHFAKKIRMDGDMTSAEVSFKDLIYFFPALKDNPFFTINKARKFRLTGKIDGTVDNFHTDNMFLSIDDLIELSGSLTTSNLTNSSSALINLYVDELSSSLRNLKKILPGFKPPPQFYKLDPISFSGDIEGFYNDFVIYGKMKSNLGNVTLDTRLDTRNGVNAASYSGEVSLNRFDLGTWTSNPDLGFATVSASIQDGQGLTLESVKTDLNATVQEFDFKGYKYSNIVLQGILEKNLFDGYFTITDPNVNVDFEGQINIGESYIKTDFRADIEKINLIELNLSKDFNNITGKIDITMEGSSITDFIGTANVKNLDLNFKGNAFGFQKILLTSAPGINKSRNLLLASDIVDGSVDGVFDLSQIGGAFSNYIFQNHPAWARKLKINELKDGITNEQDFSFKIEVQDTKDYLELVNLSGLRFKGLTISGHSELIDGSFDTQIVIDTSFYKDYLFNHLALNVTSDHEVSDFIFNVKEVIANGKVYDPLEIIFDMKGDTARIQLHTSNILDSDGFVDVSLKAIPEGENIVLNFDNQRLQMFSSDWEIDVDNKIVYGKNYISISDFVLSDGYRSILFQDYLNKGLEVNLNNFDFLLINGLINYDKIDFAGEGTVYARVANIFHKPQVVADIQIPEFTLNGVDYGKLGIRLDDDSGESVASINLNREEDGSLVLVNVEMDRESKFVKGTVRTRNVPLNTFEFIIPDGISKTSGVANIDAEVSGVLSDIKLDGIATVVKGQTRINYTGDLINLGTESFKFSEKFIDLTDVSLYDRLGNQAIMTGGLYHDLFKDFRTDLNMQSDYFIVLDTDKFDNHLYYGTGIGEISIDYFGPFSSTDITINAITGPGTILNIPIEDTYSDVSQSFIQFFKREDIERKKVEEVITESIKLEGVDVDMNLTITQDAQVNMIFDERTNDIIKGWGDGDLRIIISREGEFNVYGEYKVERGDYLFNAWKVVSKPFEVKRGGLITWTGDPINANLNIEANYGDLRVPVNIFLGEYLTPGTPSEQEAKKRTLVDLKLLIGGTLYKPSIDFDMAFPELQGELRTYADSKMRTLRESDAELNEQVAGLIMFRSFLPSNSLGDVFKTSNGFVETTYNTLSEFLSNQMSYLLSGFLQEALTENGFVSGIDFDIGFTKSADLLPDTPQSDNYLPDEIEVHFKPRFQNDKWGFDYGTSFVNSNGGRVVSNYVIHDFVFEYYLTEDRRLKLRAYGKWDKDAVELDKNEQKYGVGVSYRKEFGSILKFKRDIATDLSGLKAKGNKVNN